MYLAYALFCEGPSDSSYFEVLLPRVIESTVLRAGRVTVDVPERPAVSLGRSGRTVDEVAAEACDRREAFHIVFVHADTGGRGQRATVGYRSSAYCRKMHELCEWRSERCVLLRPAPMTESWALADPYAVLDTLGYRGAPTDLGLPADAEQAEDHPNPKTCLDSALRTVRGNRRPRGDSLLPAIAQRQSIDALGRSRSFREFEVSLQGVLQDLGVLEGIGHRRCVRSRACEQVRQASLPEL